MTAEAVQFEGEPAVALAAGDVTAVFLTQLGMTGVSLRSRDREHLATPGGVDALRTGGTLGLPLLAPWANRLDTLTYDAAGTRVDLRGIPLHTDGNGLPIHGLLVGAGAGRSTISRRRRKRRPCVLPSPSTHPRSRSLTASRSRRRFATRA